MSPRLSSKPAMLFYPKGLGPMVPDQMSGKPSEYPRHGFENHVTQINAKALGAGGQNHTKDLGVGFQVGRMADALMVGHMCKGQHLIRAQTEYMRQRPHPYLQLVKAVMDNNLLGMPPQLWRISTVSEHLLCK